MSEDQPAGGYEADLLADGLDVVFCGINPAATAAADGHNFSHRSNRFWTVLHLAGFTDAQLRPADERELLRYGCGITAVVQRPTARADAVSAAEFRAARPSFEAKIRRFQPRMVAFLGKRALAAMTRTPDIGWGPQSLWIGPSQTWVLPNPSGLNRQFALSALVEAYRELRTTLSQDGRGTA